MGGMIGIGTKKAGVKLMASFPRIFLSPKVFLFLAVFILWLIPGVWAKQSDGAQESGQEVSVSQAQATLASLFGRGAKMPVAPRVNGTIALPSFDNSDMQIDERVVKKTED